MSVTTVRVDYIGSLVDDHGVYESEVDPDFPGRLRLTSPTTGLVLRNVRRRSVRVINVEVFHEEEVPSWM